MKYFFLLLCLSTSVLAASLTIEKTVIPINAYSINTDTIIMQRTTDEYSPFLLTEAADGLIHSTIQLDDYTFTDAVITSVQTDLAENNDIETVTVVFHSIVNWNNCARDICTYLQDTMGVRKGSTKTVIPLADGVLDVKTIDNKQIASIILADKTVTAMDCCVEPQKPTHTIRVKDQQTLSDIAIAQDSTAVVKAKMDAQELLVTANTVGGKIILFFAKLFI